jgi:multidrug efflux pump subunit AcrA (membrane-fusion protein)
MASLAIVACSSPEGNSLEAKKKELESLNKQIAELQTQAKNLEMEILELDSTGSTGKLVAVQTLESSSFESYVSLEGVVDAEESTLATAQVPGLVTQVLVKAGQRVSKGQTLAILDQSTLNKSRIELQQKLEFATTVFDKQARLWSQGIGTEIQYLNAKNQK